MTDPLHPSPKARRGTDSADHHEIATAGVHAEPSSPSMPMDRPDFSAREFRPLIFMTRPSVWLIPPGKEAVRAPTSAIASTGEPVQLVDFVAGDDAPRTSIPISDLRNWLKECGFVERPADGTPEWGIAVRDDIGVAVYPDEQAPHDVGVVIVAFDLCRAASLRLPAWWQAVTEACDRWPLRLYDRNKDAFCDVSEFPALIERESAWQVCFGAADPIGM